MDIKQYKEFLTEVVKKNVKVPICAVGSRGVGKSQVPQQVAREQGLEFIDLRLALMEPGDLLGLPERVGGETRNATPSWLPKKGTKGIIILEEFNRAPRDCRQAIFQLLTERKIHEYVLPDGWFIWGAINPDNGNYQVEELDAAFVRRFLFIGVETSAKAWLDYSKRNIDRPIFEFILEFNDMLNKVEAFSIPKAVPNPASYYMLNEFVKRGFMNTPYAFEIGQGLIGEAAMAQFITYLSRRQSPVTGEEVVKSWNTVKDRVREQENDSSALTMASVVCYTEGKGNKLKKEHYHNIVRYWVSLKDDFKVALWEKFAEGTAERIMKKLAPGAGADEYMVLTNKLAELGVPENAGD
jgi:hypothetical protein